MPISPDTLQEWFMEDIDWNAETISMKFKEPGKEVTMSRRENILQYTLTGSGHDWVIPYRVIESGVLIPGARGRISTSTKSLVKTLYSKDGSRAWTLHSTKVVPSMWSDETGIIVAHLHLNGEDKGLIAITSDTDSWNESGESMIEVYRTVYVDGEWVNLGERIGQADPEKARSQLLAEIDAQIEALHEAKNVITEYNESTW